MTAYKELNPHSQLYGRAKSIGEAKGNAVFCCKVVADINIGAVDETDLFSLGNAFYSDCVKLIDIRRSPI